MVMGKPKKKEEEGIENATDQEKKNSKTGQGRVGTADDPGRFGDIGIEEPSVGVPPSD